MPEPRHPSPETLLAYHERALSEVDAERVRDHLVECTECASVILDLESFPDLEPPTEEHRLGPADLRRQWADIERRIAERPLWWQRHQVLLPIAATLLVAAVVLGIWGQGSRPGAQIGERLSGDIVLVELTRVDAVHRGPSDLATVPEDVGTLAMVLDLAFEEAYPTYSLDIRSSDDTLLAEALEVRRSPEGLVTVMVPREVLAPGPNFLHVFGERRGERVHIATFGVRTES